MRIDTLVNFIQTKQVYDPVGGSYLTVTNTREIFANVTDVSSKKSIEEFGEYIPNLKAVRIVDDFDYSNFDSVKIGGVQYSIIHRVNALGRQSFTVKGGKDGGKRRV